ncbi:MULTISPECIES: DUF2314 domain-containing protein [unclassified Olleya]|uniref:DUF2314 domain-containing protein n=1 Tax=unclassified Olleya TaxID=2615019 RepID=UPI000C3018B7|nr:MULTISPECIES: DUF2314 domain-containing protein [unclassified Olleya]AUC77620.1 hypothetical protein CW732_18815 [Olleya sp. Bg11-27]QXP59981.1 DUF2314 domain-containing protein [Olleya sp. HaHaR_3_96]
MKEDNKAIFYAKQNKKMEDAYVKAQTTFNYFWREVYWEGKRVVPAHDLALVKIPFQQVIEGREAPLVEHMWISDIDFDGELITGVLQNAPNKLTNVAEGDTITRKLSEISDWMLSIDRKTYGGYTIQVLRSGMTEEARVQHDKAWGLDFGDYNTILVAHLQEEEKENLIEHPMSKAMEQPARDYFTGNLDVVKAADENGVTRLHTETIAGNETAVKILLELGADKKAKTKTGKTALDFATTLNWSHLIPVLQ